MSEPVTTMTPEDRLRLVNDLGRFCAQEWFDGPGIGDICATSMCALIPAIARNQKVYINKNGALMRRLKKYSLALHARAMDFVSPEPTAPTELRNKYGTWGGEISYLNLVGPK